MGILSILFGAALIAFTAAQDEILIKKRGIYKGASGQSTRSQLGEAMRAVVNSLSTPLPGNAGNYVSGVQANAAFDVQDTNQAGVDGVL